MLSKLSYKGVLLYILISITLSVSAEDAYIAGTIPSQRPANAPVIKDVIKNSAWYKKALTGISHPYPNSLRFLEDQGNWSNPFTQPGMKGPYDIREWHTQ